MSSIDNRPERCMLRRGWIQLSIIAHVEVSPWTPPFIEETISGSPRIITVVILSYNDKYDTINITTKHCMMRLYYRCEFLCSNMYLTWQHITFIRHILGYVWYILYPCIIIWWGYIIDVYITLIISSFRIINSQTKMRKRDVKHR